MVNIRVVATSVLVFLLILQLPQMVFANHDDEKEEYNEWENELSEKDDGTEEFGKLAATLLIIGLIHPAFKYVSPFFMERKKVIELSRKYSLHHGIIMVASTILALIHHFSSEIEVLGYPALILMVLLSITGALMKFSIHPKTKRYAAILHFQKIFTLVLLASLYLHITVGD